jgi:hypothetical protein
MKRFFVIAWLLMLSLTASAQVVQVKGVGTASYAGSMWLSSSTKEKAYQKAQLAAVERYFAENGESESENFEAIQDKIEANLDKFILGTTILNEQDQSNVKKYTVAVRVELNVAKLRNTLRGASPTAKAASGEKSQLVYLFMGREASSVKSYDARVVKRAELSEDRQLSVDQSVRGREGESFSRGQVKTSADVRASQNSSAKVSRQIETGGSVTRKADETNYRLLPLTNVKTAITSVFSQGGFNVADPEFVLGDAELKSVSKDFSAGDDLAPSTLRSVVASLRKSQVPLLVLATLDVGVPSEDPATGMQRVAVAVTSRVLDISGNLPREVASVPAIQYFGIGPDNAVARTKALKDASTSAAREIVSRLNSSGVR